MSIGYFLGMYMTSSTTIVEESATHVNIKTENDDNLEDSSADVKNPLYDCPHCDTMFKNFSEVEKHIRIKHNSDLTENVVR